MTTYAPNFTPRLRVHYVACGLQHTIQVRAPRGTGAGPLSDRRGVIHDIFNLWAPKLCTDFAFISAEYALTDSELFTPIDPPFPVTGTKGPGLYSAKQKVTSTNFAGRAATSRARFSLFGILWIQDIIADALDAEDDGSRNGIVTPAENALVADTATAATSQFFANSGEATSWYPRATIKTNDHLLKLVRRGTIS